MEQVVPGLGSLAADYVPAQAKPRDPLGPGRFLLVDDECREERVEASSIEEARSKAVAWALAQTWWPARLRSPVHVRIYDDQDCRAAVRVPVDPGLFK